MLHLLQLYNMVEDKEMFIKLFSNFAVLCDDMGYSDDMGELFNELLDNHFLLFITNNNQLDRIVNTLKKHSDLAILSNISNIIGCAS